MVVAAVAAGAVVAAGQTINNTASAVPVDPASMSGWDATSAMGGGEPAAVPGYLPLIRPSDPAQVEAAAVDAVAAMAKGERLVAARAAREAQARRALFALPAEGILTSGYGARWGTIHSGIDIANSIGTPIVAAADGVVAEAGPASGFGLWIRIRHADGTTTVYGHINRTLVEEGERVRAGDEIAEMGNRGHSTGPHLHFEVWNANGKKINPLAWFRMHGIEL
ncbi:MAG: M23 family metallopeptidase [Pseudonocardiales bacterium]